MMTDRVLPDSACRRVVARPPTKPTSKTMASKSTKKPLRVAVRCSWSGARLAVPSSSDEPITASSSIESIITALSDKLPPSIFESTNDTTGVGATVVYTRTAVSRDKWTITKLKDLGIDGDDGAGVMLVLNLPSSPSTAQSAAAQSSAATASAGAASPTTVGATATTSNDDIPQPMEIEPTLSSPSTALDQILSQNFDADSIPCVLTLIKILDNIITKPNDPKVRSIKLSNAAFERKVRRVKGSIVFLVCCGFETRSASVLGNSNEPEVIELREEKESTERLVEARKLLADRAVTDLGVSKEDIPSFRGPPPPVAKAAAALSGASSGGGAGGASGAGRTTPGTFDPYKTHSFNAQAAASGAPNPHSVVPTEDSVDGAYVSRTERELNALKSKQEKLERKLQKLGPDGRALAAFLPGQVGSVTTVSGTLEGGPAASSSSSGGGGGKSDGSLLAARMKRMEEERKKREEGGFTTKAMRDLESMKKAKVYTHATLRIGFADGSWITAKFLPTETVQMVRDVLVEECFKPELAQGLKFDLYVAPPRRMLDPTKRLDAEGLVPAARVHVSWKVGGAPPSAGSKPGSYLREGLFGASTQVGGADYNAAAFPNAKKLVEEKGGGKKRSAAGGDGGGGATSAESREEALMARMLGKKPGLLGRKGSSASSDKGDKKSGSGGGKPKWFK